MKRKDSLEGGLDQVLFAVELKCPKMRVPRLPQNTSKVNTDCAGKSKKLYSFCDQFLGALISLFDFSDSNVFDLIIPGGNCAIYGCSKLKTTTGV